MSARPRRRATTTSYAALRTRAIESLLIEKGLLSEEAVDVVVERLRAATSGRCTARGSSRAPGSIPPSSSGCSRTRRRRRASWRRRLRLASTCAPSRTPTTRAQRRRLHALLVLSVGACSACRRPGTSRPSTARASCASRAPCCASSACELADGDRDPRLGLERRRALHRAARAPAGTDDLSEDELAALVTRDAMIGTGAPTRPAREHERAPIAAAIVADGEGPAARRAERRARLRGALGERAPSAMAVALCERAGHRLGGLPRAA